MCFQSPVPRSRLHFPYRRLEIVELCRYCIRSPFLISGILGTQMSRIMMLICSSLVEHRRPEIALFHALAYDRWSSSPMCWVHWFRKISHMNCLAHLRIQFRIHINLCKSGCWGQREFWLLWRLIWLVSKAETSCLYRDSWNVLVFCNFILEDLSLVQIDCRQREG